MRPAFSIKILKTQVTYCNDTLIITIGRPGELEGDPFMTRCYCSSPKVATSVLEVLVEVAGVDDV